jgi:hypothetical protein
MVRNSRFFVVITKSLIAAAIILKLDNGWSWFITLSDYPRITQDGI